jgi:hypothetical protein
LAVKISLSSTPILVWSISFYGWENSPLIWILKTTTNQKINTKNIKKMKKSILTIAIAVATVLGIGQSAYAATSSKEEVTTLTEVTRINKIEIHGNVELYLSDGTTDQVKVYNKYYAESAMVQDQNGVLRISSYKAQKLVVWVNVTDLQKLSVYDNAEVKSFGKLSALDLDVKLYNNASARLDMNAYEANITLNDHSTADLSGNVTESTIHYDKSATVNTTDLATTHAVKKLNFDVSTIKDAVEFASL